jgi:CRP-like cAMP-binding protein
MPVDITLLESLEFFADLDREYLGRFAASMNCLKVTEGETLTRMGDVAGAFFIVLDGNFMICFKNDRAVTIHEKGEIVGWSAAVAPFQYTGTTVALTEGEVLALDDADFLDMIRQDSGLGDVMMKKLGPTISTRASIFKMT